MEKNGEKREILRMNDAKSWVVQLYLYLQRLEGLKHKKWRKLLKKNCLWMKAKNFCKLLKKSRRKFWEMKHFFDMKFLNVWRSETFPFSAVVNFP